MSPQATGVLMLCLLVPIILLGFPTAFVLLALGFVFGYLEMGNIVFDLMVSRAYAVMTNDVLAAIPLFIFMGYILERSGILDRMFLATRLALGPIRGALAHGTLATSTIFGIPTGIVGASVTLIGVLAMPAMLRAGYDKRLAAGVITAGGCLGILLPPSVMLVLYAATTGQSVISLYAAAFIPGFLLSALYFGYVAWVCWRRPEAGPPLPKEERAGYSTGQIIWILCTSFFPMVILILAVLGTIALGWATQTEAAAVGCIASMGLSAAYRALDWRTIKGAVLATGQASAMVLFLLVGSSLYAAVFAHLGGSKVIGDFLINLGLSQGGFIWLTMAIIFLLGWPLEWTEIVIIFVPLFVPLLKTFNVDPVWYGILVALNLQTAFLSPPVAMAAFYLKGVSPPEVTLADIMWGMVPFMLLQLVGLVLCWAFPWLVMIGPELYFKYLGA